MEATGGSVSLAASGFNGRRVNGSGHRELVARIVVAVPDAPSHDRWDIAMLVRIISLAQEIASGVASGPRLREA